MFQNFSLVTFKPITKEELNVNIYVQMDKKHIFCRQDLIGLLFMKNLTVICLRKCLREDRLIKKIVNLSRFIFSVHRSFTILISHYQDPIFNNYRSVQNTYSLCLRGL